MSTMSKAAATSSRGAPLYVDDVFSVRTYVGTRAAKTITNGVNLAVNGGAILTKLRDTPASGGSVNWSLYTSALGFNGEVYPANNLLEPNTTAAGKSASGSSGITALTNGYSMDTDTAQSHINYELLRYVSWTFRKAKKFFDVVTYVGDGQTDRNFPHNLGAGSVVGMAICKAVTATGNWVVQHRSLEVAHSYLNLNSTAIPVAQTIPNAIGYNDTTAYVHGAWPSGANDLNVNGVVYQMLLFAHDPTGMIQCDSFTTDASGNATVTLGWEAQALVLKNITAVGNWEMLDHLRGMPASTLSTAVLSANLTAIETVNTTRPYPTAAGFKVQGLAASSTYVFMAIRRANKPPASGAEVFQPIARTGTGTAAKVTSGILTDLVIARRRDSTTDGAFKWWDRLRGKNMNLNASTNAVQVSTTTSVTDFGFNDGFNVGTTAPNTAFPYILYALKRSPGVFDALVFKGEDADPIRHNLAVRPEMCITKTVSAAADSWQIHGPSGGGQFDLYSYIARSGGLLYSDAAQISRSDMQTGTYPNTAGELYVCYLFATLPGVSKVGAYTGNGSSQVINCGFANGARFILIRQVDNNKGWYVWDSARGIVAGTEPVVELGGTVSAENSVYDSVNPDPSGFAVNYNTFTNINASGEKYDFVAIS